MDNRHRYIVIIFIPLTFLPVIILSIMFGFEICLFIFSYLFTGLLISLVCLGKMNLKRFILIIFLWIPILLSENIKYYLLNNK